MWPAWIGRGLRGSVAQSLLGYLFPAAETHLVSSIGATLAAWASPQLATSPQPLPSQERRNWGEACRIYEASQPDEDLITFHPLEASHASSTPPPLNISPLHNIPSKPISNTTPEPPSPAPSSTPPTPQPQPPPPNPHPTTNTNPCPFRALANHAVNLKVRRRTGHFSRNDFRIPLPLEVSLAAAFPTAPTETLILALDNLLTTRHALSSKSLQSLSLHPIFHLPTLPSLLTPAKLYTLLHALSYQAPGDPRPLQPLVLPLFNHIEPHLPTLHPGQVVGVLQSLAAFGVKPDPLLTSISTILVPAIRILPHVTLYNLTCSAAKLDWYDSPLMSALADKILPHLSTLQKPRHLAHTLSIITHIREFKAHPEALPIIASAIKGNAARLSVPCLPDLIHAIPTHGVDWKPLLEDAIAPIVLAKLPHCDTNHTALILLAAQAVRLKDAAVYTTALQHLHQRLCHMRKTAELVIAAHAAGEVLALSLPLGKMSALAAVRAPSKRILDDLAPRVRDSLDSCNPNQLAKVLHAYAQLKGSMHEAMLLHVAQELAHDAAQLTEHSLVLCVRAIPEILRNLQWSLERSRHVLLHQLVHEGTQRVASPADPHPRVGNDRDRLVIVMLTELVPCGMLRADARKAVLQHLTRMDMHQLGLTKLLRMQLVMDAAYVRSPRLQLELLQRLPAVAHSLKPAHLADLLYVCRNELQNQAVPPLRHAVCLAIVRQLHGHTLFTLARTLLGLCQLCRLQEASIPADVLDMVASHVVRRLLPEAPMSSQTSRDLGRLLSAYAELRHRNDELLGAVAGAVKGELWHHMHVGHCVYVVRAFVQLGHRDEALFACVAQALLKTPEASTQWRGMTVMLAEAYAQAGVLNVELMNRLAAEALSQGPCKAGVAVRLVCAFGAVGFGHTQLLDSAGAWLLSSVGDVSLDDLQSVIAVYKQFQHPVAEALQHIAQSLPQERPPHNV